MRYAHRIDGRRKVKLADYPPDHTHGLSKSAALAKTAALAAEMRNAGLALAAHKVARDRLAATMVPGRMAELVGLSERGSWSACHGKTCSSKIRETATV